MTESIATPRKSKYNLTGSAHLKVPAEVYYILKNRAEKENIHWSELARDYIVAQIKKVS